MKIKLNDLKFYAFLLLLILMPFHYVLFSIIFDSISLLSLWRDFLILLLMFTTLGKNMTVKNDTLTKTIFVIIGIIIIYLIFNLSGNTLNLARTYIVPILIYFYTSTMKISGKNLDIILKILLIVGAIEAIYGIFQAFILGPQFLIDLGYLGSNGRLASSSFYISGFWTQQRVVGTFVSPNNCGYFFAFVIIICWTLKRYIVMPSRIYYLFLICNIAGLIGTFSRSAWLGAFLGILVFNKNRSIKLKPSIILFALVGVISMLLFDNIALNGKMFNMLTTHIINTLTGESSSNAHFRHLFEPIEIVISHPFGLGFGTNGSFAISYLPIDNVHLVESSIYIIMYEIGIVGCVIFYFPYLRQLFLKKHNTIQRCSAKISLFNLCVYTFLPSIQAYEQPFFFWMVLGLSVNESAFIFFNCTNDSITSCSNYIN